MTDDVFLAGKHAPAVIFDMDGVIFDSERACRSCWSEVMAGYGIHDIDDLYRRCIGVTSTVTHDIVESELAPRLGAGIAEKILSESSALFHARYDGGKLPVKDGAPQVLKALKDAGIRTGLASSTKAAIVRSELEAAGLIGFFEVITGGDDVVRSKPDPQIYLQACSNMGIDPSSAFAIEDSYNGVRSASAAGLYTIMVPDIIPPDDEMRSLSKFIAGSLFEALDYILEITGKLPKSL